jgi:hypothetical protein
MVHKETMDAMLEGKDISRDGPLKRKMKKSPEQFDGREELVMVVVVVVVVGVVLHLVERWAQEWVVELMQRIDKYGSLLVHCSDRSTDARYYAFFHVGGEGTACERGTL